MNNYLSLQEKWDAMKSDFHQEKFNEIAYELFDHYYIKRGSGDDEVKFYFLEVELYYFKSVDYEDWKRKDNQVFVYERFCTETGILLSHPSGVDICFQGNVTKDGANSDGGGILIRSLLRVDANGRKTIVTGPWDCCDALFQYFMPNNAPTLIYTTDKQLRQKDNIVPTKRCNSNSTKDENYDLCYYDKRYEFNGHWSDLNNNRLERYMAIKKDSVTNTYGNKPWLYKERYISLGSSNINK